MPLHPVSILIGTTLAVIGSGYAFKKFVYDPHLAPYIDASIAAHLATSPPPLHRRAVPVHASPPSSANSTARQDRGTELRRRRPVSRDDLLASEPLINDLHNEEPFVRDVDYKVRRRRNPPHAPWPVSRSPPPVRSPSQRPDFPANLRDGHNFHPSSLHESPHMLRSSSAVPLEVWEPTDVPWRQQHRELTEGMADPGANLVHSTVFSYHSPVASKLPLPTPGSPSSRLMPLSPTPVRLTPPTASVLLGSPQAYPESTSFSFMSLSQMSSPSPSHTTIHSLTLDQLVDETDSLLTSPRLSVSSPSRAAQSLRQTLDDQWTDVPRAEPRLREEDVYSLSESTWTSGYEDAEIYPPGVVPRRLHLHSPVLALPSPPPQGLGMSEMSNAVAGWESLRGGPGSVVSLSESEGWEGASDWGELRSGASV